MLKSLNLTNFYRNDNNNNNNKVKSKPLELYELAGKNADPFYRIFISRKIPALAWVFVLSK
jgi:hypothetical protein